MSICADTSFLLSLYVIDVHTPRSVAAVKAASAPILVTPLNEMEFANALELRCFRKELAKSQARRLWSDFETDLIGSLYAQLPVPAEAFSVALRLAKKHSAMLGTRSLDLLHVACALSAGAEAFYTFDNVQGRLAALEGLRIL
jgi:predicted nucleic acid-binding protein